MRYESAPPPDPTPFSRLNRERREHPVIQSAYPRAEKLLAENAIDPNTFKGFYTDERIAEDLALVNLRTSQFESGDLDRTALVLEGIIFEHLELSNWLGQGVETIRASRYDDIKHGVDLIAEFNTEGFTKHLALGVDVTFSTLKLEKKFAKIKKEIDEDTLTLVSYFESPSQRGELKNIPRTIIGVENNTVIELAALWVRNQNTELANHFIQVIIAKEILEQLQAFLVYAQSIGAENAIRSYTQAISMLTTVLKKKTPVKRQPIDMKRVDSDRVYLGIQSQLEAFRPIS